MKTQPTNFRTEERKQVGRRCWLYHFNYEGTHYYFASFDVDVTVTGGPGSKMADPQTFVASQISHTRPEESIESMPSMITVSLPVTDVELRKYLLAVSPKKIDVEIWRVSSASLGGSIAYANDLKMMFKGVVDSLAFDNLVVAANCVTQMAQEDRPIPNFMYQKTCNAMLYGALCGANKALFSATVSITAINKQSQYIDLTMTTINVGSPSRTVTITSETFAGGYVEDTDGNKMGVVATELPGGGITRLWLNWMPRTLAAAANVTVYCGCLRIKRTCDELFFNLPNFRGHPYIPINNPAVDGVSTG